MGVIRALYWEKSGRDEEGHEVRALERGRGKERFVSWGKGTP